MYKQAGVLKDRCVASGLALERERVRNDIHMQPEQSVERENMSVKSSWSFS